MQGRMYSKQLPILYYIVKGKLVLVQGHTIMGYIGELEKGYLIFYLITDQIIVSPYTMLSRSFA